MGNNKGNMVLLTIIAIATLLVAVVGATFAYFGATVEDDNTSTTIEVTSGTLSIEYDGNSKLDKENFDINEEISKSFDITGIVSGSTNLNYEVDLVIDNNSFLDGALVYTVSSINKSNNGNTIASTTEPIAIPTGNSVIKIGTGNIAGPTTSGATHSYVITIKSADGSIVNNGVINSHVSVVQSSN